MSVNRHRPHVMLRPEADANLEIANGFHSALDALRVRSLQVLRPAGGWGKVLKQFESIHRAEMERCHERHMILVLDLDRNLARLDEVRNAVPDGLRDRVFVLSTLSEPEDLRPRLGSFESIGQKLARDCRENTSAAWSDILLLHNGPELERLRDRVRPILFA